MSTADFHAWLRDDGLVQVSWREGVAIDAELARSALNAVIATAGSDARGLLVDMRKSGPMNREARAAFSTPTDHVAAAALWVESPLSVMVANFFIGVSRAPRPTRMFTSEADAVAWLHAQPESRA